ncbi:hypothetical protein [Ferroacidibacillus organovorans]|uniref:hypothetical protein n=1 Tax=Ferroacidibacillus organovorans TaxID=1765683 RepID=UPI0011781283|nr:hypothetical protein [Ferroacidibacillus organovorans]
MAPRFLKQFDWTLYSREKFVRILDRRRVERDLLTRTYDFFYRIQSHPLILEAFARGLNWPTNVCAASTSKIGRSMNNPLAPAGKVE